MEEHDHVWDYEYPIKTPYKGKVYLHFPCRYHGCMFVSMKNKDGSWTHPTLNKSK